MVSAHAVILLLTLNVTGNIEQQCKSLIHPVSQERRVVVPLYLSVSLPNGKIQVFVTDTGNIAVGKIFKYR